MSFRTTGGTQITGFTALAPTPGAPTIVSAMQTNNQTVTVVFNKPSYAGSAPITQYTVVSTPENRIITSTSDGSVVFTGLTIGVTYYFRCYATNSYGDGPVSNLSNTVSIESPIFGSTLYNTPGTYTWTAPPNVFQVTVVCVGGGGGGLGSDGSCSGGAGGGLGYRNYIPVTPGVNYQVTVGAGGLGSNTSVSNNGQDSYFIDKNIVAGLGGQGATFLSSSDIIANPTYTLYNAGTGRTYYAAPTVNSMGGRFVGDGGGVGGNGGIGLAFAFLTGAGQVSQIATVNPGAGGGTGGYLGNGGNGADGTRQSYGVNGSNASAGSGGGGGGATGTDNLYGYCFPAAGGGVGLLGLGIDGTGGTSIGNVYNGYAAGNPGSGGSGGQNGSLVTGKIVPYGGDGTGGNSNGGLYGGGGASTSNGRIPGNGANGAVRIIWPGFSRQFPQTNVT